MKIQSSSFEDTWKRYKKALLSKMPILSDAMGYAKFCHTDILKYSEKNTSDYILHCLFEIKSVFQKLADTS